MPIPDAPVIDGLPEYPMKSDGVKVFNQKATPWNAALSAMTAQLNLFASWMTDNFSSIANDKQNKRLTINEESTTDYTLNIDDEGSYRRMSNTSPKSVTVNISELENGAIWHFRNVGVGDLTFIEGSGVTIYPNNGGTLVVPQNGTASLLCVNSESGICELFGQTVAS